AAQSVHVDAASHQPQRGRITRVAPSADPSSRMFEVEVTLPNADGALKPGMIAWLELAGAPAPAQGSVPLNAVVRPPGETSGYAVFVAESHGAGLVARMRRVSLGEMSGDRLEVTGGLQGGERVIVRGATLAVDAQDVRIVP